MSGFNRSESTSFIQKHLKRNYTFNTFDGIFYFLGLIFLHRQNVLPVFISKLGGSNFAVSLIPVLHNMGVFFPSIFIASYLQSLSKKQPYILKMGLLQRFPWLIAALLSFFIAGLYPDAMVIVLLATVFTVAIATGLAVPAFFNFTAKTIPITMRGKLFALRNMGSYLLGLAMGGLMSYLMSVISFPYNYSTLLVCGFFFIMLSELSLALIKEPESSEVIPHMEMSRFLKSIPEKLKQNPNFIGFMIGRALYSVAFLSCSYFAVHLTRKYNLSDSEIGLFAIITAATFVFINPLLGFLGDKYGHKINMIIGSAALVAGNLVALFSDHYIVSLGTIVMSAIALSVRIVSGFTMTMEFCREQEIPTYIGMSGLAVGLASVPIAIIGIISNRFDLPPLFAICLGVAALQIVLFLFFIKEPRKDL